LLYTIAMGTKVDGEIQKKGSTKLLIQGAVEGIPIRNIFRPRRAKAVHMRKHVVTVATAINKYSA